MHKISVHLIAIFLATFFTTFATTTLAETLAEYASACKTNLGFTSIPQFSCNDVVFREPFSGSYLGLNFSESRDSVAHKRVNDSVDAVFACRWVGKNGASDRAVSGEMIVHNRLTGGTCFFELQDTFENAAYPQVDINPASPTHSTATRFWKNPANTTDCARCHTAGPYIASPQIVGALAKFGLINDGHDVWNVIYHAEGANNSAFAATLNHSIQKAIQPNCANQCHVMGGTPVVNSAVGAGLVFGAVVMPSINHVIDDIATLGTVMPPIAKSNQFPFSDYAWINRDTPNASGDSETLTGVQDQFPQFYCATPDAIEAHIVDDDKIFSMYRNGRYRYGNPPFNGYDVKLNKFNLRDGLICLNADQVHGAQCPDFKTSYLCDGSWMTKNIDSPTNGSGDHEKRSSFSGLCANPTAMQATILDYDNQGHVIHESPFGYAPHDRLSVFDPQKGLKCLKADQPDGQCSNYVVRFICP